MSILAFLLVVFSLILLVSLGFFFKAKNLHIWLWPYVSARLTRERPRPHAPTHIYFVLVDHFEPFHGGVSKQVARERVQAWSDGYPSISERYSDSHGNHPKHSVFYPQEAYDEELIGMIADLCSKGYFDLEIHLHHDSDSPEGLAEKLTSFKEILHRQHGLLRKDPRTGEIVYAFIHGNWALDNSRRDGRWCGVDNELTVLRDTGCCADFTLPSAPSETQTRKINSIYYAVDEPSRPKSHDTGRDVSVGGAPIGDLMIVQGPLALNWRRRKWFVFPRIENGDICDGTRVTPDRARLWVESAPRIEGKPNCVFVKVYTHGCESDRNIKYLLGQGLDDLYSILCREFRDDPRYVLHFVTCYEMYLKIKEIERGGHMV
jgi:hypothetical protein